MGVLCHIYISNNSVWSLLSDPLFVIDVFSSVSSALLDNSFDLLVSWWRCRLQRDAGGEERAPTARVLQVGKVGARKRNLLAAPLSSEQTKTLKMSSVQLWQPQVCYPGKQSLFFSKDREPLTK